METRFQYDLKDKQLKFHVRQRVSTEQKLEFKAVGLMDPSTASVSYRAALKQHYTSGPEVKDGATTPFKLGAGVAVVSSAGAKPAATRGSAAAAAGGPPAATPLVTLSAEKKLALLDGPNTVLTLRCVADYDVGTRQLASRTGLAKVSHKVPGFTKRQDLKLSAGLTLDWQARRDPKPSLFLQVRENNWAATLKEGRTYVTYDL